VSADSKLFDGVTTEALGNCGSTPFPAPTGDGRFRHADDFFSEVDLTGTAINRVFLVGLGTVRGLVIGRSDRAASPDEIAAMQNEVAVALADGCFGVSTGLIYPPGCFADAEEVAAVARPAGELGALYATHMRDEGVEIEAALDEAEHIAAASGCRLQVSHLKLGGRRSWDKIDWLERRMTAMRSRIDAAADRYPYTAAATDIGVIVPQWVQEGHAEARMERLRDPDVRARVEAEVFELHPEPEYWDRIVISSVPESVDPAYNGLTVREIAEREGERPIDTVLNLLAEHPGKPAAVFFSMSEDNLRRIIAWPFVAVGSDARAHVPVGDALRTRPHPRAYGTFARALGVLCRDWGLFPLEEAVRKMTSLPASRLGLDDRGVVRPGAFADLALFDPETVRDRATYADPHQTSAGIPFVIVNGQVAVENGTATGRRPGRMLRKSW
jgi:N-acyl-D-amino-acid deacylase